MKILLIALSALSLLWMTTAVAAIPPAAAGAAGAGGAGASSVGGAAGGAKGAASGGALKGAAAKGTAAKGITGATSGSSKPTGAEGLGEGGSEAGGSQEDKEMKAWNRMKQLVDDAKELMDKFAPERLPDIKAIVEEMVAVQGALGGLEARQREPFTATRPESLTTRIEEIDRLLPREDSSPRSVGPATSAPPASASADPHRASTLLRGKTNRRPVRLPVAPTDVPRDDH